MVDILLLPEERGFLICSGVTPGLNLKNEWMVCPFTFRAATPVGASTAILFLVTLRK
jgi:hypothetical protein